MDIVRIIMTILGGMGALLIGMRMLSDNLTRLAHTKLKGLLGRTARNRFSCVGMGAAVTVIAQNSGFTTVMVVGLVNAGIMSLFQATAMIMGANIGTTLAAWIIALGSSSGAQLSFTVFFLAFAAIGAFVTIFAKSDKIKTLGNALAGFGLLFVGLSVMSGALTFEQGSSEYEAVFGFFSGLNTPFAPIIFLLGVAITALVQSSTAVNTLVITMAAAGLFNGMGGNALFFIVIGSNIGTCVTALLSSIGANANAKRAALIHFMFNFFGAVIFAVIMLSWRGFADTLIKPVFLGNIEFQIPFFHTLFNVFCTLLFLPFINIFVKLANLLVRDKKAVEEDKKQSIIADLDERLLRSPSLALGLLYQETGKALTYAMDTLNDAFDAFMRKDVSVQEQVREHNAELAEANKTAIEYLVKISASAPTLSEEKTISTLHYVLNDIVRIGELADNVTKYTNHYVNDKLVFSGDFLDMLRTMHDKIKKLYVLSLATFLYKDTESLAQADVLEDEIDKDRRALIAAHIARLNDGKCQPANSSVFINLVGNLERAADHITYIAHSIEEN